MVNTLTPRPQRLLLTRLGADLAQIEEARAAVYYGRVIVSGTTRPRVILSEAEGLGDGEV